MPRIEQRAFSGGEISPALYGRTDLNKYQSSMSLMRNWFAQVHGGASTRPGFEYIGNGSDVGLSNDVDSLATRLIPFQFNTEQTYILCFGDQQLRVIRDGGFVVLAEIAITGITQANPAVVTTTSPHGLTDGDEVYLSDITGMVEVDDRLLIVTNASGSTFDLKDVDSTSYSAFTAGNMAQLYQVATPYTADELSLIKYTQSADVMTLTHPSHPAQELTRTVGGPNSVWTITEIAFGSTLTPPVVTDPPTTTGTDSGAAPKEYGYVVTAVDPNGSETIASNGVTKSMNAQSTTWGLKIEWGAVATAAFYNVYKLNSVATGIYGYIGQSETLEFSDFNLGPDMSVTPPTNNNPFEVEGSPNNPFCTSYHQQRLWFGGVGLSPQSIFASKSGDFKNFDLSNPVRSSDSIETTLATRKVNELRHLVSIGPLIALTSGGPWRIDGDADGVITSKSITTKSQGERGCSHTPPVIVGDSVLFIQELSGKIRDLSYEFESDKYTGNDLTIFAEHLFYGYQIVDWCYAEEPHSIVWAVRSDGMLLSLAYLKEQNVWGWSQHETAGFFESVASISEGNEHVVYAVVRREVNGVQRRFVERLHEHRFDSINDAFCVDSGLTYQGPATKRVIGLEHLEGQTLTGLADGMVVNDLVVSNGEVNLTFEAETIHVGLPYICDMQTLEVTAGLSPADGTLRTRKKAIPTVWMLVRDTRGLEVGSDPDNLYESKERDIEDGYGAIPSFTGETSHQVDITWQNPGALMYIRQKYPLPATVLSLIPEVTD